MFIREDLLDKIKEIFEIKEFNYMGIEKNLSSSKFPFFLLFYHKCIVCARISFFCA